MIGVFDSGFGGLTILKEIRCLLPEYDYIYLGDNARAPYGSRSFDVVYAYTVQAVRYLFSQGCNLVILACNTASAKALRSIQQNDLPNMTVQLPDGMPSKRVLGIIRPTVETVSLLTKTKHIGVLATEGTVTSLSYPIEFDKLDNRITVRQQACPMWVPIVENGEADSDGADYFVNKYLHELLSADPDIDTLLLACTHYPLLIKKIENTVREIAGDGGKEIQLLTQGKIVAQSLAEYFVRHPEIETVCSKGGNCSYLTTESENKFAQSATVFMGTGVDVHHIDF